MVRGTYDLQKLRIGAGNRIAANFRSKLGIDSNEPEEKLSEEDKKVMKRLRESYRRITDGIIGLPRERNFEGDEIISDYTELVLVHEYMELLLREEAQFRQFKKFVSRFPIYPYLVGVPGVGPAMAGVLISEINIREANYPSSLWAYAGLDVGHDGLGRSRRKEHLVKKSYVSKAGKNEVKDSITFNAFLKTKLMGVLAPCFIKAVEERLTEEQKAAGMKARKGKYGTIYENYKHRILTNPAKVESLQQRRRAMLARNIPEKMKVVTEEEAAQIGGHVHNMAMRYMVKRFLVDLHIEWRTLEGLPVFKEYHEGIQGHVHSKVAKVG